jgi:hypothetical protein
MVNQKHLRLCSINCITCSHSSDSSSSVPSCTSCPQRQASGRFRGCLSPVHEGNPGCTAKRCSRREYGG